MLKDFLSKHNLKYDELNSSERETLTQWMETLQARTLTVPAITEYIGRMKDAVSAELAAYNLSKEQDLLLKARLKNYLLLEAFLTSPEKARKAIEQSLSSIKK